VSSALTSPSSQPTPMLHVRLLLPQCPQALVTLIDSGANTSVMDEELAHQLGIECVLLPQPIAVILPSPRIPLILGYPWLLRHNPHIDWPIGAIREWSPLCRLVCLKQAAAPTKSPSPSVFPDVVGVPPEYIDYREVFSKTRATSLPPHHPYDCAIDLQPGTSPPSGCLFFLSVP